MTVRRSLPYSLRRAALPSFPIGQKLTNWHLPRRIYFAIYQKTVSFSNLCYRAALSSGATIDVGERFPIIPGRSTSFSRSCLIESFFKLRRRDKVCGVLGLVRNNRKDVSRQRTKLFSCASWNRSNFILKDVNWSNKSVYFLQNMFFPFTYNLK